MYRFQGDTIPFDPIAASELPDEIRQAAQTSLVGDAPEEENWRCMSGRRLPQWLQALVEIREPQIITTIERMQGNPSPPTHSGTLPVKEHDTEVAFTPLPGYSNFYVAYSARFRCFFGIQGQMNVWEK